jgi:hypothetical protein
MREIVNLDISELEEKLASCPNRGDSWRKYTWTEGMDQFLLKHWKVDKKQSDISRVLGTTNNTCRERYLYLTRSVK